MPIRLPIPACPITLTFSRHDLCLTPSSPAIERLCGPEGGEVRLSVGAASLYMTHGLLPRV